MYKIIGADGKEYGPITAKQLRQWIAQGRVNAATKIRPEGSGDWRLLDTFTEFAEDLATPPTLPNLPPPPASTPKTSRLAITSLVLGILGIFSCGATAVVGLVLGIIATVKIKNSAGRLSGTGLAIAGIVVSGVFMLMIPIFAAMLLPALAQAKAKAQSITCMNNARQLTLAVVQHASANSNACPPAATWCDAVGSSVGSSVFQCAEGNKDQRCHYAYNAKLDGLNLDKIKSPSTTVLLFETDGGWNVSGGSELLPQKPRHGRAVAVGFVDGHAEMVKESRLSQLQWEP